jgi:two-component system chemotaxis response regulator CheB
MPKAQSIVVIGASAGGVEALRSLAAGLPTDFPAAVFVVLHIGAHASALPELLTRAGALRAIHPKDGDLIRPGHIYAAPPDHHLVLELGIIRLTRGPRENWARPAIDPLFRSAAQAYGAEVIGVILTGALNDGTAGLYEIKAHGGITVVQDPDDAANPSMPRSALKHVSIDHCLPLAGLPRLLVRLVAEKSGAASLTRPILAITRGQEMTASYDLARPVAVTCPDCGGALRRTELGSLTQFRCHIGHVYTAEVMIAAQAAALERSLEAAMRSVNERRELCREMAGTARAAGDSPAAAQWVAAGDKAKEQAATLCQLLEKE